MLEIVNNEIKRITQYIKMLYKNIRKYNEDLKYVHRNLDEITYMGTLLEDLKYVRRHLEAEHKELN